MLNTENKIGVLNSSDSHQLSSSITNNDPALWQYNKPLHAVIASKDTMELKRSS